MRYTDTVTLVFKGSGKQYYDPKLGKMVGGENVSQEVRCNVTGASLDLQAKLDGLLNSNSLVIRFRSPQIASVSYLLYQGARYTPVTQRSYTDARQVIYANKVVK